MESKKSCLSTLRKDLNHRVPFQTGKNKKVVNRGKREAEQKEKGFQWRQGPEF